MLNHSTLLAFRNLSCIYLRLVVISVIFLACVFLFIHWSVGISIWTIESSRNRKGIRFMSSLGVIPHVDSTFVAFLFNFNRFLLRLQSNLLGELTHILLLFIITFICSHSRGLFRLLNILRSTGLTRWSISHPNCLDVTLRGIDAPSFQLEVIGGGVLFAHC